MAIKLFNSIHGFSVGTSQDDVIDFNGNVIANNLVVDNISNLGNIANIVISGGSNGHVLITNGNGNLSWTNSNLSLSNVSVDTINGSASSNSNIKFDSSSIKLSANGSANIVNISTAGSGAALFEIIDNDGVILNLTNSGSNITLTANPSEGISINNGGNLPLTAGNSNVRIFANGNVTTSVNGVSNIVTVTDAGLNTSGNIVLTGNTSVGYIDASDIDGTYSNSSTVDFANFSGMIVVNNISTTGVVALWLCGGNIAAQLGTSNTNGETGNIAYNGNIDGYTWTNDTGNTISVSFAKIKTRNEG